MAKEPGVAGPGGQDGPNADVEDDVMRGIFGSDEIDAPLRSDERVEADTDPFPKDGKLGGGKELNEASEDTEQKRYAYWQSEADKARRAQVVAEERLKSYKPVLDAIEQDEELLNIVDARIKGGPVKKVDVIEAPKAPTKPADYTDAQAYDFANPGNPSFQYRIANEAFKDAKVDYLAKVNERQAQTVEQFRAEQRHKENAAQQQSSLAAQLQTQYKFTPAEAQEFIQLMSSQESMALPNLVRFFKFSKMQGARGAPAVARRPASGPAPLPSGGSSIQSANDEEQSGFENTIKSWGSRKR